MSAGAWWFLLCAVAVMSGCTDPVNQSRIDSLGPEPGDYPQGPDHRPGQPCTWCHSSRGGEPPFDLAGTVFLRADAAEPAPGVRVRIFDQEGREQSRTTGVSGNFHFAEEELELNFPLWIKLESADQVRIMRTPIYRERGCAACHMPPASRSSAGRIFLLEQDEP